MQQDATLSQERTLSTPQAQALAALAAGQSISQAASAAGVDRTTVHRWLSNDAVFMAEFNAARMEMVETLRSGVRKLADDAIGALRDLIGPSTPANIRLRAVELVLARVAGDLVGQGTGSPLPEEIQAVLDKEQRKKKLSNMLRS
jgi:hypothetical protein